MGGFIFKLRARAVLASAALALAVSLSSALPAYADQTLIFPCDSGGCCTIYDESSIPGQDTWYTYLVVDGDVVDWARSVDLEHGICGNLFL